MAEEEACNTRLGLGIGMSEFRPKKDQQKRKRIVCLDLSFPLHPKEEAIDAGSSSRIIEEDHVQASNKGNSHYNDHDNDYDKNCIRKKLRLTKEQSTLLEDSFKLHTTLNTAQKQELAEKLNLRPRQVEVWFQNRRARTKLKQTEVDCEFLKKCCENLSEENKRLKKELQELRSLKLEQPQPFYIQFPKARALGMCPSCDKIVKASDGHGKNGVAAAAAIAGHVVHKTNKSQIGLDGRC